MKRKIICICLSAVCLLSACAGPVTTAGTDLMKGIRGAKVIPAETPADNMDFSINLLKTTYSGENTVVSPVSAYICLSMVANGAAGDTLAEFEEVLGAPVSELNNSCLSLLDGYNSAGGGVQLKSVNGIWINSAAGCTPCEEFLQINADYYKAAAVASDFADGRTLDDINRFIETNTNGLIPKAISKLEPTYVMILTNTLYFHGAWASPFQTNSTSDRRFILSDGNTIMTSSMKQTFDSARYLDTDQASGILLPYENGRFAFVGILPDGNASEYLDTLTADSFRSMLSSISDQKVELYLPKFEMTGDYKLNDVLMNMGIVSAFTSADFSAMGQGGLRLSLVRQKTVFKLNEKGTEASAMTEAELTTAMPVEQPDFIKLDFDRPFLYALMDMETGTPLFLGILENPKK
jgi:serine protease inhibitor